MNNNKMEISPPKNKVKGNGLTSSVMTRKQRQQSE